jgi:hypothetical protein
LDAFGAYVPVPADGESAGSLRLGQIVEGAPSGDVAYTILLGNAPGSPALRIVAGTVADADVVLVESYDTARGLASGELTTGDAIRAGLVKVRGAAKQLAANEDLLVSLGEALGELRARTVF